MSKVLPHYDAYFNRGVMMQYLLCYPLSFTVTLSLVKFLHLPFQSVWYCMANGNISQVVTILKWKWMLIAQEFARKCMLIAYLPDSCTSCALGLLCICFEELVGTKALCRIMHCCVVLLLRVIHRSCWWHCRLDCNVSHIFVSFLSIVVSLGYVSLGHEVFCYEWLWWW